MQLIKYLLIIGAAILTTSCSTTVQIHVPFDAGSHKCTFKNYSPEDESIMTDEIGRKIKYNLESCKAQRTRINELIKVHNEKHSEH